MTDKMYRELRALRDSIDRVLQHEPNSPTRPYFKASTGYVQTRWWEPPTDNVTFTYYPKTTTAGGK